MMADLIVNPDDLADLTDDLRDSRAGLLAEIALAEQIGAPADIDPAALKSAARHLSDAIRSLECAHAWLGGDA